MTFSHISHALRSLRIPIAIWLVPARQLSEIVGEIRPNSESSGRAGFLLPNIAYVYSVDAVVSRPSVRPGLRLGDLVPEWWMLAVSVEFEVTGCHSL